MGRDSAKFIIYKPFGAPLTQAMSMNLLTADEWAHLVQRVQAERIDFAPSGEEPRTHAVTLKWEYGTDDTALADWTVQAVAGETTEAAIADDILQTALDALLAKATLTADEQKRQYELERDLTNLRRNRYWQEVLGSFGDGARALYRACNAPNVPFKIKSNWKLNADRPFTVWLHRCRPHEAQQNCWVRVRFGHWALTIKQESQIELTRYKDGRYYVDDETQPGRGRGRWTTFRGTDFAAIEAVEAQIAAIEDVGRLTAAEKEQILAWQVEIDSRTATIKNGKLQGLSAAQVTVLKSEIAQYKQRVKDLKSSKGGLSEGQQQQIKALKDSIIAETQTVTFANMAEALFNKDFALTIMPQRRGFLVLHNSVGRDYFVFEDREVTDGEQDATIVAATPVQIDGNGGALWFKTSYIKPALAGWLQSGERYTPRVAPTGMTLAQDATTPVGTGVTPIVTQNGDTAFSWRVLLSSDGRYLPYLYRLWLDVPATPRDRSVETSVFDSSYHAATLKWEVGSEYSRDNRGRAVTLTLTFDKGQHIDLLALANYQVVCKENGEAWFTGILQEPSVVQRGHTYIVTYRGYDRWAIMRSDKIWVESFGDAKTLGTYFGQMAAGAGLHPDEIVVTGTRANMLLPRAAPGKTPLLLPEFATARADWLQRLYDDFAWQTDMWFDGRGRLHLEPQGTVTKAIAFHLTRTDASDLRYMMDYTVTEDWSEFANAIIVFGAEVRGRKLCAQYVDWSSIKSVGRVIAADPYESSSLKTQALVNAACRWRALRYGRPHTEGEFTTGYDETVEIGDRLTANGLPCEVLEARADERRAGQMTVRVRFL